MISETLSRKQTGVDLARWATSFLTVYALAHIGFMVFVWLNHIGFQLNLEPMELTMLQHTRRAMTGQPIYPEPSSEFVALAYNPLYYLLVTPVAKVFGATLFSMRLTSILGMLGAGAVIFLATRRHTGSSWWGLMAVGLFAAAYNVMETYLDNAFPDSWMLFSILLGVYLVDQHRSQLTNLLGILCLVMAFWFKQPGAVFTIGAVVYLTWRQGWRRAWPAWALAAILGPGLYLAASNTWLGSYFHYYTLSVPRQWVHLDLRHMLSVAAHLTTAYGVLIVLAGWVILDTLRRRRYLENIWFFLLPCALLSVYPGVFDSQSAYNLYIPLGVWLIMVGLIGLKRLLDYSPSFEQRNLHLLALALSFALLLYNPRTVIVPAESDLAYQDLVTYLQSIDGTVYAPWIGPLQADYEFYPTMHWVPMVDLIRRPGVDWPSDPTLHRLLDPVTRPAGNAYVLTNIPLAEDPALSFLSDSYKLVTDHGDRFAALTTLPKRFTLLWPRYLYRYQPRS